MVAGGPFVLDAARRSGSPILPVDSEHSALFQCIAGGGASAGVAGDGGGEAALEELLLTGSGGPFRGRKAADLAAVTPEQALAHPNWSMGPKITIDSATLMNKGLELIEAHYLFGVPYERITVVLDPRSTVHSMARFSDGAILAHLGVPDMRTPIGWALAYPERPALPQVRRLDLFATSIAFERPDTETFRCLALAEEAGTKAMLAERAAAAAGAGPKTVAAPIVLNAANEVAVAAFLERAPVVHRASPRSSRRASTGSATRRWRRSTTCTPCDAEARALRRRGRRARRRLNALARSSLAEPRGRRAALMST